MCEQRVVAKPFDGTDNPLRINRRQCWVGGGGRKYRAGGGGTKQVEGHWKAGSDWIVNVSSFRGTRSRDGTEGESDAI